MCNWIGLHLGFLPTSDGRTGQQQHELEGQRAEQYLKKHRFHLVTLLPVALCDEEKSSQKQNRQAWVPWLGGYLRH